jgi:hypothetical protein
MLDGLRGVMEAVGRDYARRAELAESWIHPNHV